MAPRGDRHLHSYTCRAENISCDTKIISHFGQWLFPDLLEERFTIDSGQVIGAHFIEGIRPDVSEVKERRRVVGLPLGGFQIWSARHGGSEEKFLPYWLFLRMGKEEGASKNTVLQTSMLRAL